MNKTKNGLIQTETYQKTNENSKFPNLKLLNNNVNLVSKTLILGAHDNVPCAPELGHIDGPNTNIKKDKDWLKLTKKTVKILKPN